MISKTKLLAGFLALAVPVAGLAGCSSESDSGTERWVTTENTNVDIDWNKVNEAYKTANGPDDLEKKINEIYEGKEIISVSVQDTDDKTQVVTGFFDKNTSGSIDEGEKIFTIKRTITGDGQGSVETQGHGHYASHGPSFLTIAAGMMMGSMMANAMMGPRYVPMYTQPYTTSAARHTSLSSQRSSFRASNPTRFSKPSRTGKTYGGSPSRSGGGGRMRGGGRFGLARAGRTTRPVRLDG
ncbi:MAG: hypothetical protein WKG01_34725 [Kofleriaceae bacterium]